MFPIVIANKFKKILDRLWTKWERFYAYGLFVWFKVLAHLVQLIWRDTACSVNQQHRLNLSKNLHLMILW